MSAARELSEELRCDGEPGELAEMCKRFLQFTAEIIPTARRYPGGSAALLRDRTAAARYFAWFSTAVRGAATFGNETRGAAAAAPWESRLVVKRRRLLTYDRAGVDRAPGQRARVDRAPANKPPV
jgi:hypothetical protein